MFPSHWFDRASSRCWQLSRTCCVFAPPSTDSLELAAESDRRGECRSSPDGRSDGRPAASSDSLADSLLESATVVCIEMASRLLASGRDDERRGAPSVIIESPTRFSNAVHSDVKSLVLPAAELPLVLV